MYTYLFLYTVRSSFDIYGDSIECNELVFDQEKSFGKLLQSALQLLRPVFETEIDR